MTFFLWYLIFRKALCDIWSPGKPGKQAAVGCPAFLGGRFSFTIFQHFLWRSVSKKSDICTFTMILKFSLQVHWITRQEEEIRSSCQAVQVWKILNVFCQCSYLGHLPFWLFLAFQTIWSLEDLNYLANIHIWKISHWLPGKPDSLEFGGSSYCPVAQLLFSVNHIQFNTIKVLVGGS